MPTLSGPRALAAHLRSAKKAVIAEIITAEQQTIKEAMAAADRLSSGGYSQAELDAFGHPYARAHPDPSFDAAIINVQKGTFRKAWRATQPKLIGGAVVSKIANNSKPAKYMAGTKKMVARPIAQAILAAVSPDREKRLTRIRQAIRKGIIQ